MRTATEYKIVVTGLIGDCIDHASSAPQLSRLQLQNIVCIVYIGCFNRGKYV